MKGIKKTKIMTKSLKVELIKNKKWPKEEKTPKNTTKILYKTLTTNNLCYFYFSNAERGKNIDSNRNQRNHSPSTTLMNLVQSISFKEKNLIEIIEIIFWLFKEN